MFNPKREAERKLKPIRKSARFQCKHICYISGPMTGLPESEFVNNFLVAEESLSEIYAVANPAHWEVKKNQKWEDLLATDLYIVSQCQAIYLLKDWEKSLGARIECATAIKYNLHMILEPGAKKPDLEFLSN